MRLLVSLLLLGLPGTLLANPFVAHGPLKVSKSGTFLEHEDGTPFFFLADTCWTGPALSSEADWAKYLADRKAKGFTAIQFNMVSPWRAAPTDAEGNIAYVLKDGELSLNEAFYKRLDARFRAINEAGLLAVPVLCWAHKKGDAGVELNEAQITRLCQLEVERYKTANVLWILAGDNRYRPEEAAMWKRIGRAVFADQPGTLVTTHPTGTNFPWKDFESEKWLTVLGYQSGHGDDANTWRWLHSGPPAEYGQRSRFTRPLINLEPPYEGHNGYSSRKPHTARSVRRAMYWSLLVHPIAGVTYGGHGVWSWHTKPGTEPTDHRGSGVAKVWSEAINLPAAGQLRHLRAVFERLPWTELRPAQKLLSNQPGTQDPTRFIAVAATPNRNSMVAYVPDVQNDFLAAAALFPKDLTISLMDPRTGNVITGSVAELGKKLDKLEDALLFSGTKKSK